MPKKVMTAAFLYAFLYILFLLSGFCHVSNVKHNTVWHSKVKKKNTSTYPVCCVFLPCHCSYNIHCTKISVFHSTIL